MILKLVRNSLKPGFTEGKLYVDNVIECFTVEDEDRHLESGGIKVQNQTAIPRGRYKVTISMSTRFNKFMLEVLNVPGFAGIRIHSGNSSKDTEGCIILGAVNSHLDDNWVSSSKIAVDRLFTKVKKALSNKQEVWLEVV